MAAASIRDELAMSLIDTAEMYGDSEAEQIIAESTIGQHQDIPSVMKVYPHNSSRLGAAESV